MDVNLRYYILWALCEESAEGNDKNKIYIGEAPGYEAFYERVVGEAIDPDDYDDEIPEAAAYFDNYELTPAQLGSIRHLSLIGGNSVYEMLINPIEDNPRVQSLEGIRQLVNLESIDLEWFRGSSLEELASLQQLKEIANLPLKADYAPLLRLPSLTRIHVSGVVSDRDFGNNPEVLEQLRQKGVQVADNNLQITESRKW